MKHKSPPGPLGERIPKDTRVTVERRGKEERRRRQDGSGGSSLLHAADGYRRKASELFRKVQATGDPRERRRLIREMERATRLAVDLEKKAGRR